MTSSSKQACSLSPRGSVTELTPGPTALGATSSPPPPTPGPHAAIYFGIFPMGPPLQYLLLWPSREILETDTSLSPPLPPKIKASFRRKSHSSVPRTCRGPQHLLPARFETRWTSVPGQPRKLVPGSWGRTQRATTLSGHCAEGEPALHPILCRSRPCSNSASGARGRKAAAKEGLSTTFRRINSRWLSGVGPTLALVPQLPPRPWGRVGRAWAGPNLQLWTWSTRARLGHRQPRPTPPPPPGVGFQGEGGGASKRKFPLQLTRRWHGGHLALGARQWQELHHFTQAPNTPPNQKMNQSLISWVLRSEGGSQRHRSLMFQIRHFPKVWQRLTAPSPHSNFFSSPLWFEF